MRVIIYIYILTVACCLGVHEFDAPGGDELMVIANAVFAGALLFKAIFEFWKKGRSNLLGAASLFGAAILGGIAMKVGYVAYADQVLLWTLVGTLVLLLLLLMEARSERVRKSTVKDFLYGSIPLLTVAAFVWYKPYDDIFTYYHQSKVAWDAEDRLDWESFEGQPEHQSNYDATIFSNINYRYRVEFGEVKSIVVAHFDPHKSWHKKGKEALLEHEKMHFDITEVYAAKLRYFFDHVDDQGAAPSRRKIEEGVAQILSGWDAEQHLYDDETQHGLDYAEQLRWQDVVDTMLAKYGGLKAPVERFIAYDMKQSRKRINSHAHFKAVDILGEEDPSEAGEFIFTEVDEMPEFPGGEDGMHAYLKQHIRYPIEAKKERIEGMVYVSFFVDEEGIVRNVKIEQGIGGVCDEEALRVVRQMPLWTPGKLEGTPVKVQLEVPIRFRLR